MRSLASSSAAAAAIEEESPSNSTTTGSTDAKSDGEGSTKKKKKKRRRFKRQKQKTPKKKAGPSDLQLKQQLKQHLDELFEEMAPVVILDQLENYVALLSQKMVDQSSKQEPKPKNWSQSKILSFLEIIPLQARSMKKTPADVNLRDLKATATILRHARDKTVLSEDLEWSQSNKGPKAELRREWHSAQTEKNLQLEALDVAKVLAERLPSKRYQSLIGFLSKYVETPSNQSKKRSDAKRKVGIRRLFGSVAPRVGGHVHLVAPELARFFYFDPPLLVKECEQESAGEDSTKATKKKPPNSQPSISDKEVKVKEAKKRWEESKERFVRKLLALHKSIHSRNALENTSEIVEEDSKDVERQDEEALAEIVSANLQKEAAVKDYNAKKKDLVSPKTQKRKVHLIYDAMVDDLQEADNEYSLSADTTVFVDNLPIDITEDELLELYSRCGALESVEIFNKRKDLDPGALAQSTLKAMALQQRKQGRRNAPQPQHNGYVNRWARPRTPVYGMLTFGNEMAAQAASQDSLRIFGMIVRGHSVRTLKGKDMTRLYVDNIERDLQLSAMDIEHKLSQLLNPGLFVSLDITSSGHKKSKRVLPGSFEVMFPTFEVANEAFGTLREDLDLVKDNEDCTINWIRTPLDAHKYWTRELGGVV